MEKGLRPNMGCVWSGRFVVFVEVGEVAAWMRCDEGVGEVVVVGR